MLVHSEDLLELGKRLEEKDQIEREIYIKKHQLRDKKINFRVIFFFKKVSNACSTKRNRRVEENL